MPENLASLSAALLEWYARHARRLPWRVGDAAGPVDSYAVWVSEIMLQQTRVETVTPYFERWMSRFPDLAALAAAPQQDVLSLWEGLGYYSRARNLHKAAQMVVAEYHGELPRDSASLRRLPGIGRYTAGAIASIAFGLNEAALDGNIRRVYTRLFDISEPVGSRAPDGERRLWELATTIIQSLPPGAAGNFNQALMDLGATFCTPRKPSCPSCPLAEFCQARAAGVQEERPVEPPRPQVPRITVAAAVIRRQGLILLAQRPFKGLLGGLWEFPGGKLEAGEDFIACLQREICEELQAEIAVGAQLGVYRHAYTHFKVTLHAFECHLTQGEPQPIEAEQIRWVQVQQLLDFPMGKIDRQISRDLLANAASQSTF